MKQPWEMDDNEYKKYYNEAGFENGWSKALQNSRKRIAQEHGHDSFNDIPSHELTQAEYIEAHRIPDSVYNGGRGYPLDLAIEDHTNFIIEAQ